MAGAKRVTVAALNVAATPHPLRIYEELLSTSAGREIHLSGSDWAKITGPTQRSDGVLFGRILVWTDIDKKSAWLNTHNNEPATELEKLKIAIPDNLKPHFRTFYYGFQVRSHILIYESTNEFDHSFGPIRARKFFSTLFYEVANLVGIEAVEVTVIPENNSIDMILNLTGLRRLKIVLVRPNPGDDLHDEVERVLSKLKLDKAKSLTTELIKAANVDALTPVQDTRTLARVAALNGYVEGEGRDERGTKLLESTKEHPKRISYGVWPDQSSELEFLRHIANFSPVDKPDEGN